MPTGTVLREAAASLPAKLISTLPPANLLSKGYTRSRDRCPTARAWLLSSVSD